MNPSIKADPASLRMILIDDDPSFGFIMKRCAERNGIILDFFEAIDEINPTELINSYDIAIVDYDLGSMAGETLVKRLSQGTAETPLLLISGTMREPMRSPNNPQSVLPFHLKNRDYQKILATAITLCAESLAKQSMAARRDCFLA